MTIRKALLLAVLLPFAAFSAWVVVEYSYLEIFTDHFIKPTGMQVIIDLVIAISLALFWMIADARKRNITVWPFVLISGTLGSIGPLAYLVWRETKAPGVAITSQAAE